jgi:hypothetical protein
LCLVTLYRPERLLTLTWQRQFANDRFLQHRGIIVQFEPGPFDFAAPLIMPALPNLVPSKHD